MQRFRFWLLIVVLVGFTFGLPAPALAQDPIPTHALSISTNYPGMVVGIGETVTLNLDVRSPVAQTVDLEVADLPQDWAAEFRGDGRIIQSVFVGQNASAQVELRVTSPETVKGGTYGLKAVAQAPSGRAEFPIELTVREKVPAQLSFETEFPTLRGGSDSPFNFATTLKNDGNEDVTVNLLADAPKELAVTFKAAGKDITNLPTDIKASGSERIDITVEPLTTLPVGTYPITVLAQAENLETNVTLTAEVTGQPQLILTTPDERLSGDAYLGRTTPIKLVLRNTGNSPAAGVTLTASSPSGWTVTLNPERVIEVPANGEVQVTANVQPSDKAVAGDYMITFRAQPNEGTAKSADFRVTVRTSTLWGIVGVALIAVAVGIVGMAVVRFGRR